MGRNRLSVDEERSGATAVVKLAGELDMPATFQVEPKLERVTRDPDVDTLVLDMDDVEFIDSSGIGLLLATQQRLQTSGIGFMVANPSRNVRRVLELTRADETVPVTTWPSDRPGGSA